MILVQTRVGPDVVHEDDCPHLVNCRRPAQGVLVPPDGAVWCAHCEHRSVSAPYPGRPAGRFRMAYRRQTHHRVMAPCECPACGGEVFEEAPRLWLCRSCPWMGAPNRKTWQEVS